MSDYLIKSLLAVLLVGVVLLKMLAVKSYRQSLRYAQALGMTIFALTAVIFLITAVFYFIQKVAVS
jgi:hypothetical protein